MKRSTETKIVETTKSISALTVNLTVLSAVAAISPAAGAVWAVGLTVATIVKH